MSMQVFAKECEKRGFVKYGKSYMRVVGDGVFQHILPDFKERLHHCAPGYSLAHRYEPRILIYLKSLYASYDGPFVSIDRTTGYSLNVPQLLDHQYAPFMGADTEMARMMREGLDILDSINSQQKIIAFLEPLSYDEREGQQHYSTQLYDLYLYCGEFYKARMAIETEFAENHFACMSNCKRDPGRFSESMRRFQDLADSYYERYMLTFPVRSDAAKARLERNYQINSRRMKELGIPLP